MIRHLFKLVWNRKRTNALLIVEIFFSFLVLFAVETLALYFLDNYRRPLGFSWENVWSVQISVPGGRTEPGGDEEEARKRNAILQRLLREVRTLPQVEAVSASAMLPYDQGAWTNTSNIQGKEVSWEIGTVTEDFDRVLGLEVVAGRWFEETDQALAWDPVVIDRDLARAAYGTEDPVGKTFREPAPGERPSRVVGVVSDFRKEGELAAVDNFQFRLYRGEGEMPRSLAVRLRPGTPATFEEELAARLQGVAPELSFQIKPLSAMRTSMFRMRLAPLIVGGVIAFFLLLMVGLGLIGVLWQNLLQRTREIGLRRATGASRSAVHGQLFLEQLILTTLGVFLGVVLAAQLPLLGLLRFLNAEVLVAGMVAAAVSIYLLAVLCAVYPSTLASRVQPAEALRYE